MLLCPAEKIPPVRGIGPAGGRRPGGPQVLFGGSKGRRQALELRFEGL